MICYGFTMSSVCCKSRVVVACALLVSCAGPTRSSPVQPISSAASASALPSPVAPPPPSASAALPAADGRQEEPAWCDPAGFAAREFPVQAPGVQRLHAFKIGGVTLVGLAVGYSPLDGVRAVAKQLSSAGPDVGYCTWYYNVNSPEAAKVFLHHPVVPNPIDLSPETASELFAKIAGPNFDQDPVSMITCAERFGYVALGCDAQKHRGPSAFAMLLAFSGCTPEHAAEIANRLWGLNRVPPEVRLAIARTGFELGNQRPASRKRLQASFSRSSVSPAAAASVSPAP